MFDLGQPDGKPYKKGDWQKYCVHNEKEIKGFFGDYRWMSNFQAVNVFGYPSVENAYMAAKVVPSNRDYFKTCSPYEAKKNWKNFTLVDESAADWDNRKLKVMEILVWKKFSVDEDLRKKLTDTGDKYLEELNWWGDTFWGVDIKKGGENNLGKILMKIRSFWMGHSKN
jgi:ribA/ribD-fused uncharacterized protein